MLPTNVFLKAVSILCSEKVCIMHIQFKILSPGNSPLPLFYCATYLRTYSCIFLLLIYAMNTGYLGYFNDIAFLEAELNHAKIRKTT